MYSKKTLKHFTNPKFAGEIKDADAIGEEGNKTCGDIMRIYLKVDKNIIKKITFKTFGCVAAIATSDVLCGLAKGKKIDDALKISAKDIIKELGELPPVKYHCSILGTQALKNAIEDYKKNENNKRH